jgi:YVTN family beta-propeller protein
MKYLIFFLSSFNALFCLSQEKHDYNVVRSFPVNGIGGWDYIAINDSKLYVSHGTQVNIIDENSGDSVALIPNTKGVHGIAFNKSLNKGYTSNGGLNNVSVFDLNTNKVSAQIQTGENPDAILYEPFSKTIITCNGRSNNLTVIDPVNEKVIATIAVGGKPETAVTDEQGKLFVNIEDKNEIVEIDLRNFKVKQHWPLQGGEEPTGLAIDKDTKRLFAGCDKKLVVLNAENGSVVATLPIGEGCDGVAFSDHQKIIFTSNGEGTMTAIKENTNDKYVVLGNYITKKGARTIALDQKTATLYLPTADFDPVAKMPNGRAAIVPGSFRVLVIK